jgi:hypothetical protein
MIIEAMSMVADTPVSGKTIPKLHSVSTEDPIFAVIESHKAARAKWISAVSCHGQLETELPPGKCRSSVDVNGEHIVATDDPRWIECEREVMRTSDAEMDAACALLDVLPTTLAGACALLSHANAYDTDGEGWPRGLYSDDDRAIGRSWYHFLVANLAAALPEIGTAYTHPSATKAARPSPTLLPARLFKLGKTVLS